MTTPKISLASLRCAKYGAPDVHLVAPGHEPERHDLIGLMERPVPIRAWCSMECLQHKKAA